jgi:hypothetical protein
VKAAWSGGSMSLMHGLLAQKLNFEVELDAGKVLGILIGAKFLF